MRNVNTKKFRKKIVEQGLTNKSLADMIEVDRSTISNILRGKYKPSYIVIESCYDALNLTPTELEEIFFEELTNCEAVF